MFNAKVEELRPARVPKMKQSKPQSRKHVICGGANVPLSDKQVKELRSAVIAALSKKSKE